MIYNCICGQKFEADIQQINDFYVLADMNYANIFNRSDMPENEPGVIIKSKAIYVSNAPLCPKCAEAAVVMVNQEIGSKGYGIFQHN